MVFGRMRDLISGGSSELLPPRPQQDSHSNGGGSSESGRSNKKTYLRLSSSLQDLSTYNQQEHTLHLAVPLTELREKEKEKEKRKSGKKKKCMLVLSLLFVLAAVFLCVLLLLSGRSSASRYYVVLDSGSTGTRVYVYKASPAASGLPFVIRESSPPPKPSVSGRAYHRVETEPGFHKLVHNSSGVKAAIRPLLQWAEKQIPRQAHGSTSLFLYATAGVRRLPPAQSKWVLDKAWSVLRASPFECRREWVRAVSGTEEAYLGWVALNQATGVLGARPRKPTFGALDLGGSSLQVTFESDAPSTGVNLRIGKVEHHLTAYSRPGYGLNDAFDKSVARLLSGSGEEGSSVGHPCLQTGYSGEYACSQCGRRVSLVGAPDWEKCSALARGGVAAEGLPRPYGQVYAMSGFYVVFRFFNLSGEGATLEEVLERGRRFCGRTWEEARSSVDPQPFIEQYCFRAPYVVALLREGLQVKESQILMGSGSITWTLGVAVLEAAAAFSGANTNPLRLLRTSTNPLLLLSVSALLLLSCSLCWRRRLNLLRARFQLPLFRHNSAGDGRAKTADIQLMESSSAASIGTVVSHSYSSNNLGQMQFDPFWAPHNRGQMCLQSRRSQSREDLHSQLSDPHLLKT